MRHRSAVLIFTLLALSACSDSGDEPAAPPPPAAAGSPAPAVPSAAPPASPAAATTVPSGRPEIVTNPDGTVNSGGPRPATSDSQLTAGGIGPYKIGVARKDLESAKLVGKVTSIRSENCAGYATAKGLARYKSPALMFFEGRLLRLTVTADVQTDKGVRIGTTMAKVKASYPDGKQIDDFTGRGSWLATVGDFGLLFDMRDGKVAAMQAGMTEPMQFKYTDNQGC
jgi:hypothetical protein